MSGGIQQQRQMVEQLRREAANKRAPLTQTIEDIKRFVQEHSGEDFLLHGFQGKNANPYSVDKPVDAEAELAKEEMEHTAAMQKIAQQGSDLTPIGKTSTETFEENEDEEDEDEDSESDHEEEEDEDVDMANNFDQEDHNNQN